VVWSNEITKSSEWSGEWYVFKSGDKRALPSNVKQPSSPDIRERATRLIVDDIAGVAEEFVKKSVR